MKIHSSPFGEIKDLYNGNCAQFMRESPHIQKCLDKKILIDSSDSTKYLTGKQLLDLIGQVHHVLDTKYGISYNSVVCIYANNSINTFPAYHGILSAGGIVSPANVAYVPDELVFQIDTSKSELLITNENLYENATKASSMSESKPKVVLLNDLIAEAQQQRSIALPVPFQPGDSGATKDAFYCFSSGTSGVPKCVMSTHQNLTSNCQQQIQASLSFYSSDFVFGAVLPLSHIYGLSIFAFTVLYKAATAVVFDHFDFEELLKSVIKFRITNLHVVPPMVVLFAKSPVVKKYPEIKRSLKALMSGAAPLSKSLIKDAEDRLGVQINQGYGLTESSPVSHFFDWDSSIYNKASIGWLVPGQEARIVGADGKDVETLGDPGELWMRGPNIMKGYLKNPKATADTLTADRWLRTGDIAVVDKTGQFYIVDRAKELIKSKGHQVAPAELESLLLRHPNVADCAVIGFYSEAEASELPRAFVVLQDKNKAGNGPLDIKKWLDGTVSRHKRLWGGVVVIDQVPKSPSGKILRRFLKERKNDVAHGMKTSKL